MKAKTRKQILFYEADIPKICKKQKVKTLRSANLGLEVGDLVRCAVLYRPAFAVVKVVAVDFVEDYEKLNFRDFRAVGYRRKGDYLKEPYNISNPNKSRFIYTFELVEFDLKPYFESFH